SADEGLRAQHRGGGRRPGHDRDRGQAAGASRLHAAPKAVGRLQPERMNAAQKRDPVDDDAAWPKPPAPGLEVSATIRRICTGDIQAQRGMSALQRMLASLGLSVGVVGLFAILTRDRVRIEGTFRDALIGAAGWGVVQAVVLWAGL